MPRPVKLKNNLNKFNKNLNWYILWIGSVTNYSEVSTLLHGYTLWVPTYDNVLRRGYDCPIIKKPIYPEYIFIGVTAIKELFEIEKILNDNKLNFKFLRNHNNKLIGYPSHMFKKTIKTNFLKNRHKYSIGEYALVLTGPLAGFYGKVERNTTTKIYLTIFAFNSLINFSILSRFSNIFLKPIISHKIENSVGAASKFSN